MAASWPIITATAHPRNLAPSICSTQMKDTTTGGRHQSRHPGGQLVDSHRPVQAYPAKHDPSVCNENLPNDSVYHRFLYILQVGF